MLRSLVMRANRLLDAGRQQHCAARRLGDTAQCCARPVRQVNSNVSLKGSR